MEQEWTVLRFLQRRCACRTKHKIASSKIIRTRDAALRCGGILVDTGYGLPAKVRLAIAVCSLICAVGIAKKQKAYRLLRRPFRSLIAYHNARTMRAAPHSFCSGPPLSCTNS